MATKICSIEGCTALPRFECGCQNPPLLLCDMHIFTHTVEGLSDKHQISLLHAKISDKENEYMKKVIFQIEKKKKKGINRLTEECSEKMRQIARVYTEKIFKFSEDIESIIQKIENAIYCQSLSSEDRFLVEINESKSLSQIEQKDILNKSLVNLIMSESFQLLNPCQKYTYSVEQNTKNLIRIHNKYFTKNRSEIKSLTENFGRSAGICKLKDGNIFYCDCSNDRNSCYIINPITKNCEKLPPLPETMSSIVPHLIKNYIYVFGGITNTRHISRSAYRYSITQNKWDSLPNMPAGGKSISCISVNDSILLSISSNSFYSNIIYEYNGSSYQNIFSGYNSIGYLLKTASGRLFYLNYGEIYESSENDYKNWKKIGKYKNDELNGDIMSSPEEYKDHFVWMVHPSQYVRFNYDALTIHVDQIK